MSLYVLVFLGTTPVSSPIVGWVAQYMGAGVAIWLGAVISLATALAALVWQLRHAGHRLQFRVRPTPRLSVVPL
jgi:hypothetical protein